MKMCLTLSGQKFVSRNMCGRENVFELYSSTFLQVPFLNLMSLLKQRAGGVHIRVGGNTQEVATIVDSLPDGKILQKGNINPNNPVSPPQPSRFHYQALTPLLTPRTDRYT